MSITTTTKRRKAERLISTQLIALGLLTLANTFFSANAFAQERNYLIEVLVFENLSEKKKNSSGTLYYPKPSAAIGLTSDKAASLGFGLLDDALVLGLEQASQQIRQSGNFRLLKHFAWRQPGLDAKNAHAIRINIGQTIPIYIPDDVAPYEIFVPASMQPVASRTKAIKTTTVAGTLKVRLGRFLHLDTKLVFTDAEKQKSYRLSQSRKMRSGEFHYIDNPRFGLLVKILPLEQTTN